MIGIIEEVLCHWFYDMYGEGGTSRVIKNTTVNEPPQYGRQRMIKCNDGYQYILVLYKLGTKMVKRRRVMEVDAN